MCPADSNAAAGGQAADTILEITQPDGATSRVPLLLPRVIIGRSPEAHVRLACEKASRQHAELFRDPFGRWWIRDLGSRNGTRVGGAAVRERVLSEQDRVQIGACVLALHVAPPAETHPHEETTQAVPVSQADSSAVTSLTQMKAPSVSAAHLKTLLALGQELMAIEDRRQRLGALCGLMVGPEFGGWWAAVLRLRRAAAESSARLIGDAAACTAWQGRQPHLSRNLLRAVAQRNEPVMATHSAADPADVRLSVVSEGPPISALACPLQADAQSMDVLYAVLPTAFGTSEWLALASLAVEELRQADRAWTARQDASRHAAIEQELLRARQIQMRLIPRDPRVPGLDVAVGFEPCRWVGGDYVDVLPMPGGKGLLTVADACGKGLQAALVAASVHSMVHAAARAGADLPAVMLALNDHLLEYLPEESFVTMIAASVDPAAGQFQIVNAGHPPALVLEPGAPGRWLQAGVNPPLGIAPATLAVQDGRLDERTLLVLFTDGLTDLTDGDGRRLGLQRLGGILEELASHERRSAADLARAVNTRLDEIHGSAPPDDDRAFLLARRA
ncbi:MAG: FHA domain-containing protein [Planctomycetes bacterium]|nr:FHA domain-containing protein [Planctomycetota bacterium]